MRHEMLQMMRERLALFQGFACANSVRQGDVAEMTFGVRRSRERQHVGRLVLAPETGVEVVDRLIVGEQDDEAQMPPFSGSCPEGTEGVEACKFSGCNPFRPAATCS